MALGDSLGDGGGGVTLVFAGGGAPVAGQFYQANGISTGNAGGASVDTQAPSLISGTLVSFSWNTDTGTSTNNLNIRINGTIAETVQLTGISGQLPLTAGASVTAGDLISVDLVDGTAIGSGTICVGAQ